MNLRAGAWTGAGVAAGLSQWWFWATVAAAAGLAAGGAVAAVEMTDRFDTLDNLRVTCFDQGQAMFPWEYSSCLAARNADNEGRLFGALAGALLAGAGLAGGAALALAFFTDWGGEDDPGLEVGLTPLGGDGQGGLCGAVLELGASF